MTRIPLDAEGWKVNPDTGTIHTRYATHASGFRTRTEKGVLNLLDGKPGKACAVCFGKNPPYPVSTQRAPQKRRTGKMERESGPATMATSGAVAEPTEEVRRAEAYPKVP